jgi:hypothetical protein
MAIRPHPVFDRKLSDFRVLGTTPRRREEHNIRTQRFGKTHEVSDQKLDALLHTVHTRVMPRHHQALGINLYSNHEVTGQCELDGVAADPGETINYRARR